MISFKQYIIESFDEPYKWYGMRHPAKPEDMQDYQQGNFYGKSWGFETDDKRKGEVTIYEYDINPPDKYQKNIMPGNQGRIMEMHFSVESETGGDAGMLDYVTGKGDAMRIFATVLDVVQEYVKKNKPDIIRVFAMKQGNMDVDRGIGSRIKLYDKLVKRYAGRLGYKYDGSKVDIEKDRRMMRMQLIRKGFETHPKGHLMNP